MTLAVWQGFFYSNTMRQMMGRDAFYRATRSLRCMPFKKRFFEEVEFRGMNKHELCRRKDWETMVFAPFGEERAEGHFEWMIRIGVLRREVDGQGLTDRFRLTPFGAKVVNQWEGEIPRAGIRERISENFFRHLRMN
jgi:hypothetical protein